MQLQASWSRTIFLIKKVCCMFWEYGTPRFFNLYLKLLNWEVERMLTVCLFVCLKYWLGNVTDIWVYNLVLSNNEDLYKDFELFIYFLLYKLIMIF